MSEEARLVQITAAERALAEAETVPEVKDIRDKAAAIEMYLKQKRASAGSINIAIRLKLRAERKAGGWLAENVKHSGGTNKAYVSQGADTFLPEGITRNQSSQYQKVAAIPEERFEGYIAGFTDAVTGQADTVITRAGLFNNVRGTQGTGENEWYTPPRYIESARQVMGGIDLDPATSAQAQHVVKATRFFTAHEDGLSQKWAGRVWLNPPYAQPLIQQFADKVISEVRSGNVSSIIVLTHNNTDTGWFQTLHSVAARICFTRGRIHFIRDDGMTGPPTQGQMFFYIGDDGAHFANVFGQYGSVVLRGQ